MIFSEPISFREAVAILARKKLLPNDLSSAELRQLGPVVMNNSLASARTNIEGLLDRYKTGLSSIINPSQETREDGQTAMVGYNPATLRTFIKDYLGEISYTPKEGEAGTIKDLSSDKRIDLVVKTNTQLAHGAGRFIQQNKNADVVDLWPALELMRFEPRKDERDWATRWRIAAQVAGDVDAARVLEFSGRMVALKSSGIWQALGDGAGGYDDTLGNPFPPFAFNSGMWTMEVSRDEAVELGLINTGEKAEPAAFDLTQLFSA